MAKISVIIPVYKAEKYLHRCVDSILEQTFADFDIILVDDGSPDNSFFICDEYSKKDNRVHVIQQKNAGPSVARNKGIEWSFQYSSSDYLTFIDSDDCVHRQYLEFLYNAAEENNAEISMCRHEYIMENQTLDKDIIYKKCQGKVINAEDLMLSEGSSFNYAWGKLYIKKCFQEVRYPENVRFGEDNLVIFKVIFESNKIAFLEERLYYYFYNQAGITKSPWSPGSLDVFKGICVQLDYYSMNGYQKAYEKEMELYIQQYAYQIHRIYEEKRNLIKNRHYLKKLKKDMKGLLKNNTCYQLKDNVYWYEALYPHNTKIKKIMRKIKTLMKL